MQQLYDVIVVGGGTAGIMAAIQAGRAGALTLLVEKQGILGGTLVVGGVSYPASFHAYGQQIIAGTNSIQGHSIRSGVYPTIPLRDLHALLRQHGAIVPGGITNHAEPSAPADA